MGIAHRNSTQAVVLLIDIQRVPAINRLQQYGNPMRFKCWLAHVDPHQVIVQTFNFNDTGRATEQKPAGGCLPALIQVQAQTADTVAALFCTASIRIPDLK